MNALLLIVALAILNPAATQPTSGSGPCGLLTVDEVRRFFPDAKAGKLERPIEGVDLLRCSWAHSGGQLIILSGEEDQSPEEEARSFADTFLDPLNGAAIKQVRFEKIPGVGDSAVAVVERADKAKGFMRDGAYIVVRRGKSQVVIAPTSMSSRERPAVLAALTELGKAVAGRLR